MNSEIQYRSISSKYYNETVKSNEQKQTEEKEKIRIYCENKYIT